VNARNYAVTMAVCVDKASLLSGAATSRSESFRVNVEAEAETIRVLDAEIAELHQQLALEEGEGGDDG